MFFLLNLIFCVGLSKAPANRAPRLRFFSQIIQGGKGNVNRKSVVSNGAGRAFRAGK
jgi:hypothetical protein